VKNQIFKLSEIKQENGHKRIGRTYGMMSIIELPEKYG